MQRNSNIGCICSLIVFIVMGLVLWWVNECEQQEKQVLNERWEEWRIRMARAKERVAKPAIRSDLDSAAVKEMERRIWAVSAHCIGLARQSNLKIDDSQVDRLDIVFNILKIWRIIITAI